MKGEESKPCAKWSMLIRFFQTNNVDFVVGKREKGKRGKKGRREGKSRKGRPEKK